MNRVFFSIGSLLSTLLKLVIYLAALALGVAAYLVSYSLWGLNTALCAVPVILVLLPFVMIVEIGVLRILIPKPRLGVHKANGGVHFIYHLNNRIFNSAVNPACPIFAAFYKNSDIFRVLTLKAMGAKVKFSSKVSFTAKIHDPYLLTIGTKAAIDPDVQIYSFAREVGKIILRRVFIGPKSHISAASVIFPGTEVGEGSVLGMGSSTRNEMKIPQYELWVGNPASHLSKLLRPLLYTASHSKKDSKDKKHSTERRDYAGRDKRRGGRFDKRGRNDRSTRRFGGNKFDKKDRYQDRNERDDRGSRRDRKANDDRKSPRTGQKKFGSKSNTFIFKPKVDSAAKVDTNSSGEAPVKPKIEVTSAPAPKVDVVPAPAPKPVEPKVEVAPKPVQPASSEPVNKPEKRPYIGPLSAAPKAAPDASNSDANSNQ